MHHRDRDRFIEQHKNQTKLPLWRRAGKAIANTFKIIW